MAPGESPWGRERKKRTKKSFPVEGGVKGSEGRKKKKPCVLDNGVDGHQRGRPWGALRKGAQGESRMQGERSADYEIGKETC